MTDLGYGYCPVQIEGLVGDRPYYFRARGQRATLYLGAPGAKTVDVGEPIMTLTVDCPYAAGWLPHEVAQGLCQWALEACTNADVTVPPARPVGPPNRPIREGALADRFAWCVGHICWAVVTVALLLTSLYFVRH